MTSANIRRAITARPSTLGAFVAAFIIVILVAAPQAQQPVPQAPGFAGTPAATGAFVPEGTSEIDLLVGRSTVLNVGSPIGRVSLTVPDVADAMVTAPTQLLIHGKQPGTTSLFVWDRGGAIKTYEVTVRRDLTALGDHMRQLFPGEPISVIGSGKDVIISGTVSSQYVIEKAADVAAGYVEKKENVVNLLKQQEGVASNQVMLRVRFAEVSRSAMQELGASFVADARNAKWFGRATTGQFPAPQWDEEGKLVFSDFLNLFVFNSAEGLGAVVKALQNKGLFQSLAEPNLVALNGREASFLAGGEYPYPVAQPSSGGSSVTIMFKEFGVRLTFTPTVLGGDLIHLKVAPEVSSLDFSNAITLQGFRVPALSTRRTETEVELRDGQTFAIAGLMNNTLNSTMSKIPGIGDIPILGMLFRSKAHQKNQTELVVMITPTIVRRDQMGVSEGLPSLVEPYMGGPDKNHPNPDPYVGSPRYPVNQPAQRPAGGVMPAPAPQPLAPANLHPAATATPVISGRPQSQAAMAAAPTGPAPVANALTPPALVVVPGATPESFEAMPAVNATPPPAMSPSPPVARSVEAPAVAPASEAGPAPRELTREEVKALEAARARERKQREEEEKQRAAEAKRQAAIDKAEAKWKAEADKAAAKKAEQERQAAEKREKDRANEAEIQKTKGSSHDRP
jgi:pilus assembly protein CpaC